MSEEVTVDWVALKLRGLVQEAVSRAHAAYDECWKQKYDDLRYLIQDIKEEAEAQVADMKEHGLTAATIEAEGYLRCALTLFNRLEPDEPAV